MLRLWRAAHGCGQWAAGRGCTGTGRGRHLVRACSSSQQSLHMNRTFKCQGPQRPKQRSQSQPCRGHGARASAGPVSLARPRPSLPCSTILGRSTLRDGEAASLCQVMRR